MGARVARRLAFRTALAWLLPVALLVWAPTASRAAVPLAEELSEELPAELHYITTYHGQVIGTRVVRVRETEHEGAPAILTSTEDVTRISARGVTTRTVTEREEVTDLEGHGIELRERRSESGQVAELLVRVTEAHVYFETIMARVRRKVRAERKGRVLFDLDGAALVKSGGLRVGERVSAYVVARVELGIAELEAEVLEEVELPEIPGVDLPSRTGYRIRVSNVNGAGDPWEIVADSRGRTVELTIGPMRVRRVAASDARLPRTAVVLENRIPTRRLSGLEEIATLTVRAKVAEDVRDDVFPDTSYATPEVAGPGEIRLTLHEVRPDGRIPREGLSEDERSRFTSPSQLVESDAPKIRTLAEKIAGGEPEPLVQCLLITRWVRRKLSKSSRGPAMASALEALRRRAGDCTEHSCLVVALARALGIPARQALGFVHDGTGFQFHAWAEAYIDDGAARREDCTAKDAKLAKGAKRKRRKAHLGELGALGALGVCGRWVPLDATLGRVGVPAIYILLGREGDLVEYHSRANSLQGRTTMEIVDRR